MDDLDEMLNQHLKAVAYLTKLAAPHLIESHGNIVNVSSVGSLRVVSNSLKHLQVIVTAYIKTYYIPYFMTIFLQNLNMRYF
jgi:NAD(P)-dependent dehydrogenase (short-subunit alcohol dehydrogenase family)